MNFNLPPGSMKSKYFSQSAVAPLALYASIPRMSMLGNLLSGRLVLDDPEPPPIQNRAIRDLKDYTMSIRSPMDGTVVAVIPHPEGTWVLLESEEELGLIELKDIQTVSSKDCFEYKPARKLRVNDIVSKDEIINESPGVIPHTGVYSTGRKAKTALLSLSETGEDNMVISQSLANSLRYSLIHTYNITVDGANRLTNLFGTHDFYQPLQHVGAKVNPDKLLAVLGDGVSETSPLWLVDEPGMDGVDFPADKGIYHHVPFEDATIHSIDVLYSGPRPSPNDVSSNQLHILNNVRQNAALSLVDAYNSYKERKQSTGNSAKITEHLNSVLIRQMALSNPSVSKNINKMPLPTWTITIKVLTKCHVTVGGKITEFYAGKGVGVVWPDEHMPVDEDGRRAEIIRAPEAIMNRMIISVLYEMYFNHTGEIVELKVRDALGLKHDRKYTFDEAYAKIVTKGYNKNITNFIKDMLLRYYKMSSPELHHVLAESTEEEYLYTLSQILAFGIVNIMETESLVDFEAKERVALLRNSEFAPKLSKLTIYVDGEYQEVEYPALISPLYIIMSDKTAISPSATFSVSQNPVSLIGAGSKKRDTSPLSSKNNTANGIMESSMLSVALDPRTMATDIDAANSPSTIANMANNMLLSDTPAALDDCVDRNLVPFGNTAPHQILDHVLGFAGTKLTYKRDKK